MIKTITISSLASIVIYLGLKVFHNIYLTFFMFHGIICLILPLIDLMIIKKYSIKKILDILGFNDFKKTYLKGIALGSLFFLIIYFSFSFLNKYLINTDQINTLMTDWNFEKSNILFLMIIMIFANSILEEIFWRGYIFYNFKSYCNIKWAIVFTAFFYCLYHFITTYDLFSLIYGVVFTLIIFLTGIIWGYLRNKYESIYIPMISHLMANLSIMLIYFKYVY